jgi:hypothetical protein
MRVVNAGFAAPWRLRRMSGVPPAELTNLRINLGAVCKKRSTNWFELLAARHRDVVETGDLLVRALKIQRDLWHRLSKKPKSRTLLQEEKDYGRLIEQLVWEHKTALAAYLEIIHRFAKR